MSKQTNKAEVLERHTFIANTFNSPAAVKRKDTTQISQKF